MGRGTEPGGGPLAETPCNPLGLALPPSVLDSATPAQLAHLNVVQLEYARKASQLHARAYESALKVFRPPSEEAAAPE